MPLIKRYSNRKLYDTEAKRYVTLEDLAGFIRQGEDVRVVDHASGEDLTSVTLLQIIYEEQKKIGGLLPQVLLTRLIRTGDDTVQTLRSRLLALSPFQVVDEEIRRRLHNLVEQGKLNDDEAARIESLLVRKPVQADVIHIPVYGEGEEAAQPDDTAEADDLPADPAEVEALQQQVAVLEQELARLRLSSRPLDGDSLS